MRRVSGLDPSGDGFEAPEVVREPSESDRGSRDRGAKGSGPIPAGNVGERRVAPARRPPGARREGSGGRWGGGKSTNKGSAGRWGEAQRGGNLRRDAEGGEIRGGTVEGDLDLRGTVPRRVPGPTGEICTQLRPGGRAGGQEVVSAAAAPWEARAARGPFPSSPARRAGAACGCSRALRDGRRSTGARRRG